MRSALQVMQHLFLGIVTITSKTNVNTNLYSPKECRVVCCCCCCCGDFRNVLLLDKGKAAVVSCGTTCGRQTVWHTAPGSAWGSLAAVLLPNPRAPNVTSIQAPPPAFCSLAVQSSFHGKRLPVDVTPAPICLFCRQSLYVMMSYTSRVISCWG